MVCFEKNPKPNNNKTKTHPYLEAKPSAQDSIWLQYSNSSSWPASPIPYFKQSSELWQTGVSLLFLSYETFSMEYFN